jgi:ankyrin repeat protein
MICNMAKKGALIEAIEANNIVECRRLIEEEGTDVHETEKYCYSCLMLACGPYKKLDIIKLLVSNGANTHDKIGSCLMLACYCGYLDIAEFLMSKGASIYENTDVSNERDTCFSLALKYNQINILYRLRK